MINSKLTSFNFYLAGCLLLILSFSSCNNRPGEIAPVEKNINDSSLLKRVMEKGTLVAITEYSPANYFIYRGEPLGYQYELLKMLAKDMGVELEIIISNDIEKSLESLNTNSCDILAPGFPITKKRMEVVDFTDPILQTKQVLVQKAPSNRSGKKKKIEPGVIRNPLDLENKTIYIPRNTYLMTYLTSLSNEMGIEIHIIEDPMRDTEGLIAAVSKGEIEYTVSDKLEALVNQKYYPGIDVATDLSFPHNIGWVLKKGAGVMADYINQWLKEFNNSARSKKLYTRYFGTPEAGKEQTSKIVIGNGKISPYDDIIRKYSSIIGWDWRLIASLIYHESKFIPHKRAWTGAFGLMQLMPATAALYDIDTLSPPEKQIEAGIKFLKRIDTDLSKRIPDKQERVKFILASYNVGIAHVLDARRLAEKYGKDPNIWTDNVDQFLLNKAKPEYYKDPVVQAGYCRGEETYRFVVEILERFNNFKKIIPE